MENLKKGCVVSSHSFLAKCINAQPAVIKLKQTERWLSYDNC